MELLNKWLATEIRRKMQAKNDYNKAFDQIIGILADMMIDFELNRYKDTEIARESLTTLKNDILQYGDRLKLNHHDIQQLFINTSQQVDLYNKRG